LITGCGTTLGPITTGGDIVTVGPTTGPVTNVTVGGVGTTTTGLGTVPLGPTTNCGAVGAGPGPTINGGGMSASDCIDNFTTCGVDTSVVVPPPQAVNAVSTNNDAIFFMMSFLGYETS
jgi:hypothetical protein